jgi:NAD(P)-dependent dehydrogenase (short-subunit alcohol dehydrogenase family)
VSGRVAGRIALVTGAGTGIGRATCVRLAQEGATVIASSRTLARVQETAARVERDAGVAAHPVALDVTDGEAVDRVAREVAARHGRIDIVVASAGFTLANAPSLVDTTDDEWERIFRVNVTGMFRTCRAALRHMPDGGAIVTVGSINSFVAWENDGAYTASKGAVLQFTRALALDVVARGIRVNTVCPGVVDTPLTREFLDRAADPAALAAEYAAVAPMNRMGTPEEIANCILFLASDEASFVTGAALIADGGTVIRP